MPQSKELTAEEKALFSYFKKLSEKGSPEEDFYQEDTAELPNFRQFLSTPSAKVLIPRLIIGTARKAAEPLYVAGKLFKPINMPHTGDMYKFPSFSTGFRADFVGEGEQYPRMRVEAQEHESAEIRIRKSGIQFDLTEEVINYSQWDVMNIYSEEAGRAMVRHKEQQAFYNMIRHGHTVFDNNSDNPNAKTTGCDEYGNNNGTMAMEDFLDLLIALHFNGFTPTKILMNSLVWPMFVRQGLTAGNINQNPQTPDQPTSVLLGPGAVNGRLPFALSIDLSPFGGFDEESKTYSLFAVDENNVGVEIVKEPLRQMNFDDPEKDIRSVKLREMYGFGVLYEGTAIAVAKGLRLDQSYPKPPVTKTIAIDGEGNPTTSEE